MFLWEGGTFLLLSCFCVADQYVSLLPASTPLPQKTQQTPAVAASDAATTQIAAAAAAAVAVAVAGLVELLYVLQHWGVCTPDRIFNDEAQFINYPTQ